MQNRMFQNNQRTYEETDGKETIQQDSPNPGEAFVFWKMLCNQSVDYNTEAEWLKKVEEGNIET